MKTLIVATSVLLSSSAFAGKCLLSGLIENEDKCHRISTRLDVSDVESCKAFAKLSHENHFFGQIDKHEKLISTRFLYRVSVFKRYKGELEFQKKSCQ